MPANQPTGSPVPKGSESKTGAVSLCTQGPSQHSCQAAIVGLTGPSTAKTGRATKSRAQFSDLSLRAHRDYWRFHGWEAEVAESSRLQPHVAQNHVVFVSYMVFPYKIPLSKRLHDLMKVSKPMIWSNCVISVRKVSYRQEFPRIKEKPVFSG